MDKKHDSGLTCVHLQHIKVFFDVKRKDGVKMGVCAVLHDLYHNNNRWQPFSSPSMMTSLVMLSWDSTRGACSSPRRVLERRGRASVLGWTIRGSWRFLRCFCSSSALCGPNTGREEAELNYSQSTAEADENLVILLDVNLQWTELLQKKMFRFPRGTKVTKATDSFKDQKCLHQSYISNTVEDGATLSN